MVSSKKATAVKGCWETEERYRILVETAQDLIWFCNTEGCYTYLNPAWEEVFGYSVAEMLGRPFSDFQRPERALIDRREFSRLMQGDSVNGYETVHLGREGREINLVFNARAIFSEDGTVVGIAGTAHDITQQKQDEDRLRHAEKMDAIGLLAGGVAHDFNNQLNGILGYAELLVDRLDDPKLKSFAHNIQRAALRSADLTQQLLAFSRQGNYLAIPVDLHAAIEEVVATLERLMDKRITIRLYLDANPCKVTGDPVQLTNTILHLAVNACESMQGEGSLLFATSTVDLQNDPELPAGRYLQLSISDTGQGMDEETMKHIFEPFFTTKKIGEGTGLGLPAVYGAVKNHNGAVRVESRPGSGTTFTLSLPLLEKPEAGKDAWPKQYQLPKKCHILVVDDEAILREVTSELLRDCGYQVTTCANGGEAITFYRQSWKEVDLVLIDMVMPGMNGRETFRALSKINPAIKAILISGYSFSGEAQQVLDEGVLVFLKKPFRKSSLMSAIEEALAIRVTEKSTCKEPT